MPEPPLYTFNLPEGVSAEDFKKSLQLNVKSRTCSLEEFIVKFKQAGINLETAILTYENGETETLSEVDQRLHN